MKSTVLTHRGKEETNKESRTWPGIAPPSPCHNHLLQGRNLLSRFNALRHRSSAIEMRHLIVEEFVCACKRYFSNERIPRIPATRNNSLTTSSIACQSNHLPRGASKRLCLLSLLLHAHSTAISACPLVRQEQSVQRRDVTIRAILRRLQPAVD